MHRACSLTLFLLLLTGCQLPAERLPLRLLPEDGPPLPYAELLTRARGIPSRGWETVRRSRREGGIPPPRRRGSGRSA